MGKTPAKGKKGERKAIIIAAPQADDNGDEESTSSSRKIQKVRSGKGKERTMQDQQVAVEGWSEENQGELQMANLKP